MTLYYDDDPFEYIADRLVVAADGCWPWTGVINQNGYGHYRDGTTWKRAHRIVYELLRAPIPEGLTLDHLCRVRHCVNPWHLEPVTRGENALRGTGPPAIHARKTSCIHGHLFDEANTYCAPDGTRHCRTCRRFVDHARWRDDRHSHARRRRKAVLPAR
jgi:hypothetical protein